MRRFLRLALAVVFTIALLPGMPVAASASTVDSIPLGLVLVATDAHANMDTTLSGATIYDGDRLKTESKGSLRARLGRSQVYLGPSAAVDVHGTSADFSADLNYGTVVISSLAGQSFRLIANGATIRPATPQATVMQVTWVSSRELLLTNFRAAIQVSLNDEVRTIELGDSYRMVIQPEESSLDDSGGIPPQGTGGHPPDDPPRPQQPHATARNRFLWIAVPAVAAVTGVVVWRALVSPTAP